MKRAAWVVVVALLAAGSAAAGDEPVAPERLNAIRMPSPYALEADGTGGVVGWDAGRRLIARWNGSGVLTGECRLDDDARLPHEPHFDFAVRDDTVLLTFLDLAAGSETRRQAAVVDLARCDLERIISLDGDVSRVAAGPDGWLVVSRVEASAPTGDEWRKLAAAIDAGDATTVARRLAARMLYRLVDDRGTVVEEFDLDATIDRVVAEERLNALSGPRDGRLLRVGKDLYFLPDAAYELWRLPRGGRPLRRIQPPPCLRTRPDEAVGDEARERMRQRGFSPPSPPAGKAFRSSYVESFRPALYGAVPFRDLIALQVTDPETGEGRVDIWDTITELPVAVVTLPAKTGFLAFDDTRAWLTSENEPIRPMPLPDVVAPLEDPCATLAATRATAGQRGTAAGARPTPPSGP